MKTGLLLLLLALFIAACFYAVWSRTSGAPAQASVDDRYAIGFADGWYAYANDSEAIREYHRGVDALMKDVEAGKKHTTADVYAIWDSAKAHAKEREASGFALQESERVKTARPFWKSNNGLPRRLDVND